MMDFENINALAASASFMKQTTGTLRPSHCNSIQRSLLEFREVEEGFLIGIGLSLVTSKWFNGAQKDLRGFDFEEDCWITFFGGEGGDIFVPFEDVLFLVGDEYEFDLFFFFSCSDDFVA